MKASIIRFAAAAVFAVLALFLNLFSFGPDLILNVYIPYSRSVMYVLSLVSGIFPFSLAELILYALIVCAIAGVPVTVYFAVVKKDFLRVLLKSLSIYTLTAASLFFFFYATWGLCYDQPPMSAQLELDVHPRTTDELKQLCLKLAGDMNSFKTSATSAAFGEAAGLVAESFNSYTQKKYPAVKPVLLSVPMSYTGITGIFIPFTGESNVNKNNISYAIPFVMAHEMSHRHGVAREDEANFFAYLICNGSDSVLLKYSAAFMGFEYAMSRLYSADSAAWREVYSSLDDNVLADIIEYNNHWKKYESKASDTMNKVNNAYLKAQGQTDGVKSYGRMVDLLLAYVI